MKRHESIVVFSRDHHFGLLFCWKIRQGLKKNVAPERIQPYINYFWESHLRQHFEEEEKFLFSAAKGALTQQAIHEHKEIEAVVAKAHIRTAITAEELSAIADMVDSHIRFEERVLFPQIEKTLTEAELEQINEQLKVHHQLPDKEDYHDEFWL